MRSEKGVKFMTSEDQKKIIIEIVANKPGIKGTELVTEYINELYLKGEFSPEDSDFEAGKDTVDIINTVVQEGDLVEVEYVLPTMNYRIKSLYLPKGTSIRLLSGNDYVKAEDLKKILETELDVTGIGVGDDPAAASVSGIDIAASKIMDYLFSVLPEEDSTNDQNKFRAKD